MSSAPPTSAPTRPNSTRPGPWPSRPPGVTAQQARRRRRQHREECNVTERTPLPSLARPENQDESAAPALELRSVSAGYGASAVLHDVSISVPRSSVVALLGPNGAGKTTTLRAAAGLLRPTGGTVVLGGKDASKAAPFRRARQGVCLIPEGRGIFRSLTVRENLELLIPPWRKDKSIDVAVEAFPVLGQRLGPGAGSVSGRPQPVLLLCRGCR